MNFKIEIDDFWLAEDSSLEEGLRDFLKNEVFCKISDSIKKKVESEVEKIVREKVHNELSVRIAAHTESIITTGKTKSHVKSSEQVTFEEYIAEVFNNQSNWNSLNDIVKKRAEALVAEIRNKYDLLFASRIVTKMQEQNLLKDDVFKLLAS